MIQIFLEIFLAYNISSYELTLFIYYTTITHVNTMPRINVTEPAKQYHVQYDAYEVLHLCLET